MARRSLSNLGGDRVGRRRGAQRGTGRGCCAGVPDGQAVSSQGVRGDGGNAGLSESLAGRDTTPCDWGRARVSERGQRRRGRGARDEGSGGVRWRPV